MNLITTPKRHRYPVEIIGFAVWSYHRFNDSYRDVAERLAYRGIVVSYETIRTWCQKFGQHFSNVIKKRPYKPSDKWHLDEMYIKINGESFGMMQNGLFAPDEKWERGICIYQKLT